jgi:phosphoglycerate dehydrogenase-like enzyme
MRAPAASRGTIERVIRVISTLPLDDQARATLARAIAPYATFEVVPERDDLADAEAELLLARVPPRSRAGLPRLRLLQMVTAGVDHLQLDESWNGTAIATASGLFSAPIAPRTCGGSSPARRC